MRKIDEVNNFIRAAYEIGINPLPELRKALGMKIRFTKDPEDAFAFIGEGVVYGGKLYVAESQEMREASGCEFFTVSDAILDGSVMADLSRPCDNCAFWQAHKGQYSCWHDARYIRTNPSGFELWEHPTLGEIWL